jgi:type II secretory pathway component PulF
VAAAAASAVKTATARNDAQAPAAHKKVPRVQILLFTRELADLIDAGLPIDRALSVLVEQTDNDALREMLKVMRNDIRSGEPLSDALRKFPKEFPDLYANMIRAGEVSGQLPEVMTRLADFMEKEAVRKSQVMAALTYPMVLISVAIGAVIFLLVFVIPRLRQVFTELGSNLPAPTKILLGLSSGFANYWYLIIGGIAGVVFLFRMWVSTPAGVRTWDGVRLHAPLFGKLTHKLVMARFVRTLGTLLAGGVPILTAMEICGTAVGNAVTSAAVEDAKNRVKQGETLATALDETHQFLPLVVHMTAVGEETGRLPNMLVRTSDTLDFEVDNTMRRLTSLVEPLVVLLMGGFVGFVVLSILLPIFAANSLVK